MIGRSDCMYGISNVCNDIINEAVKEPQIKLTVNEKTFTSTQINIAFEYKGLVGITLLLMDHFRSTNDQRVADSHPI